jgi:glycosyltransferase involved in cell wall biosynthesis
MKVFFDDSPLRTGHSVRGIGVYTKNLKQQLLNLQSSEHNVSESLDFKFKMVSNKKSADIVHYPYFDLFVSSLPNSLLIPCFLKQLYIQLFKQFLNQYFKQVIDNHGFIKFFIVKPKKIVVTIHDVIPLVLAEHYPVGIRGRVHFLLQKHKLKNVDRVITDSKASKKDIAKYLKVPLKKISVVALAPGINQQFVDVDKLQTIIKKYHLPEKYLLYVGDINYNKNLPSLIKALALLPHEIQLVLVGKNIRPQNIPEWRAIELALDKAKVRDRVIKISSVGQNSTQDLAGIYQNALAYVQPSYYEGFGLPVLEAMQYRTPVIASNNSSLIEVVKEYGWMVYPTDHGIAKAVEEVLKSPPAELKIKIQRASQWAESFTWRKTAIQTLQVYQN